MRIGINAFPLRIEGGGARYAFAGLFSAMLRVDETNRYVIFAHLEGLKLIHQILESCGEPAGSAPDSRVRVARVVDEGQIYGYRQEFDVYFGPLNNLNPRLYDRPTVALLHDIQEQYLPDNFSRADLIGRFEVYPEICRAATTLVTISQFCKQTFVEKFQTDPRKIEVVPNAPQAELTAAAAGEGCWNRQPLPEGFLFYPANCYKHKNHQLLLDAAVQMKSEGNCPPIVFCGFELAGGYPLTKEIAARGLQDVCTIFTDLPAPELRYLYRHGLATVLPTTFEGFCMPAVEAMACRSPLIASDLPVLHEIVGDNALYFDASSSADLVRQIRRVQEDADLRQKLSNDGPAIAARFNWDDSARRMIEVLRQSRDRFAWGHHAPGSVRRPRIGVSVRLVQNGNDLTRTIESLLITGYPDLVIRCVMDCQLQDNVKEFLDSAGVICEEPGAHRPGTYDDLADFAKRHNLDLVGEMLEGNRFKPTAMTSLAWGYLQDSDKAAYLGESMQFRGDHFMGICRMRLTGDDLWKIEGYLYPETLFFNPRVMEQWPAGLSRASDGSEWRWELLREARHAGRLLMLRRTLADCDTASITTEANRQAAKAGMFDYYSATSERSVKVRLMRRIEPVIKRAARVLPMKWQDAGTRLWYHLAR
ncbi:MAG TPA: glycosyltransferase family 1 protein [Humisphaera sp.]|jgi:glycosyltransferase involved in cell wall biosynthesis|nr:glycosyltransferase family 1 protein [Humisphaera sp.]